MTATLAIVPVKPLALAKRRLAGALADATRRRLVLTMLSDVLALLRQTGGVGGLLVVTPDCDVATLARSAGAEVLLEDRPQGLNAALRRGLAFARARGYARALLIPADVPLATRDELAAVIGSASDSGKPQAILVPSHDGAGTNALLLSPPDALEPAFGPDSFVRHIAEAVARGLDFRVLRLAGLAADIDLPADLDRLIEQRADHYAFLAPELRPSSRPEIEP